MKCCCLYPHSLGPVASAGLVPLRVVFGVAFILHGLPKVQNPMGWMGSEGPPGLLKAAAAVSEFGGGVLRILGLLTRPAAFLIGCVMASALGMVHIPHHDSIVAASGKPSAEPAAVYLAVAVLFLVVGPGRFSLDAALFGRPRAAPPADHGV